jgi:hypothetical protein
MKLSLRLKPNVCATSDKLRRKPIERRNERLANGRPMQKHSGWKKEHERLNRLRHWRTPSSDKNGKKGKWSDKNGQKWRQRSNESGKSDKSW